jgi:hypothetical protein
VEQARFYIVRAVGKNLRLVSVLESTRGQPAVRGVRSAGASIEVETTSGVQRHLPTMEGWEIQTGMGSVRLKGGRRAAAPFEPLVSRDRPLVTKGAALPVLDPPALDGSLDGFDTGEPLFLDHEDQYRRSEEPYEGPEEFSATAFVNWSEEALYLAVEVTKPAVVLRDPRTPPLRLDNEPDEIHADGIQVYLGNSRDDAVYGWLLVPSTDRGEIIVRATAGSAASPELVHGRWERTDSGYRLTVAITLPGMSELRAQDEIGFDLLVNEMRPDRQRRAGQLVWSGGGGWVWLRGDRQDPARFGTLELR